MKKELFASGLLLLLLVLSVANSAAMESLCSRLSGKALSASLAAEAGDWESCDGLVRDAFDLWEASADYTHSILHHNTLDTIDSDLRCLQQAALERGARSLRAAAGLLGDHLRGITETESLSLGSIF